MMKRDIGWPARATDSQQSTSLKLMRSAVVFCRSDFQYQNE